MLPVLGIEHAQFAVVLVILIELGMITPPLGLNLFVIQGLQPKATLTDVTVGTVIVLVHVAMADRKAREQRALAGQDRQARQPS